MLSLTKPSQVPCEIHAWLHAPHEDFHPFTQLMGPTQTKHKTCRSTKSPVRPLQAPHEIHVRVCALREVLRTLM